MYLTSKYMKAALRTNMYSFLILMALYMNYTHVWCKCVAASSVDVSATWLKVYYD